MIGHHLSASAFCNALSASGVCRSRGTISSPKSARRARTQQNYGQSRDRPDDELHAPFIGLVQAASRAGVGCAVPPGKRQGSHDYRDHDDEHDRRGIDEKKSLRRSDRPLGIQYAGRLTGSEQSAEANHGPARPARSTKAAWRTGGSVNRNCTRPSNKQF